MTSNGNRSNGMNHHAVGASVEGAKVDGSSAGPVGLKTYFARRLSGDSILPSISPGSPARAQAQAHRW
jgi:hypothetical protein